MTAKTKKQIEIAEEIAKATAKLPKRGFLVWVDFHDGRQGWCRRSRGGCSMAVPDVNARGVSKPTTGITRREADALAGDIRETFGFVPGEIDVRVRDLATGEELS